MFYLQTQTPVGQTINALGVYLLVSLFFVIAAMFEFAVILHLQRRHDLERYRKMEKQEGELGNKGTFEMKKLSAKIDRAALVLFFLCYVIFNCIYWFKFLN